MLSVGLYSEHCTYVLSWCKWGNMSGTGGCETSFITNRGGLSKDLRMSEFGFF